MSHCKRTQGSSSLGCRNSSRVIHSDVSAPSRTRTLTHAQAHLCAHTCKQAQACMCARTIAGTPCSCASCAHARVHAALSWLPLPAGPGPHTKRATHCTLTCDLLRGTAPSPLGAPVVRGANTPWGGESAHCKPLMQHIAHHKS